MPTVTIFRGEKFDGADEVTDAEFPAIPRIGETVSVFDNDEATFEKVKDVNYHVNGDRAMVRILLQPKSGYNIENV